MPEHFCTGCGELHGGAAVKDPAVEIARIQAERDIKVAELGRTEARIYTEAAVEQTGIEAEAAVDEAVVRADVLTELAEPDPEPAPVTIVSAEGGDAGADDTVPEAEPPVADDTAPATSSSSSNPWWT
jgi:hypothetical protein